MLTREIKSTKINRFFRFQGQPIVQIRSASALDSLIVLTGATLGMYDIQSLEVKGSNTLSGVSCFAIDENPLDADPFAVTVKLHALIKLTVNKAI